MKANESEKFFLCWFQYKKHEIITHHLSQSSDCSASGSLLWPRGAQNLLLVRCWFLSAFCFILAHVVEWKKYKIERKETKKRTRLGSTLCGKWLRACHGNLHFQLDKGYVGLCRPPGANHQAPDPPMYVQLASPGNLARSRRCGAAAAVNMQTGIFFCGFDFTQVSPPSLSSSPPHIQFHVQ